MKKICYYLLIILTLLSCAHVKAPEKERQKVNDLLVQAYTYGFPLVLMDLKRKVQTNTEKIDPQNGRAPMNQFVHHQINPDVEMQMSTAWLDLGNGPIVLELPDTEGQYYFMPMMDAWTNVFKSPGKRTSGPEPKKFVIVGPKWDGNIPPGTEFIRSRTNMMWIIARIQGNSEKDVKDLQKGMQLYPVAYLGRPYEAPTGTFDPNQDMQPPIDKIFTLTGAEFFVRLNELMRTNPPSGDDYTLVQDLEKLGIGAGEKFNLKKFNKKQQAFITSLPQYMKEKFETERLKLFENKIGWVTYRDLGNYGQAYGKRAMVAYLGLGKSTDEDAIYPFTSMDVEDRPLTGQRKYVLHFDNDEIPDTNSFWSLRVFHRSSYLESNQIPFSVIRTASRMKLNRDKSLDVYIQKNSPGKEHESNWLKVPDEEFVVEAALYWPRIENIPDSWSLPPIAESKEPAKLSENLIKE